MTKELPGPIAFVLGGGGVRGTEQAGAIRALLERGIRPDLIVGTSFGAIHGALLAADPAREAVPRMERFWRDAAKRGVLRTEPRTAAKALGGGRFQLNSGEPLRRLLGEYLGEDGRFEELTVPLQTCAASIERATARYFEYGPLIPAVMASCALPGVLPPYRIGEEHYVDGWIVEPAPITRAASLGAKTVFVLRFGQHERVLKAPRRPWQVGQFEFELSRRHHLAVELGRQPEGVGVHRLEGGYHAAGTYLDALPESSATRAPVELSAFLSGKLDRFFDLCDQNRDDAVAEADLQALGTRIAEAFGARPGSLGHQRLEQACIEFWARIRTATGPDGAAAASLRREEFRLALARLTADRAAYDEHVFPLVGSLMAAADENSDGELNVAEVTSLLRTLGVAEGDVHMFVLQLDTDNDGVVTLEELNEAFRDFFTADEPGQIGNLILGGIQAG